MKNLLALLLSVGMLWSLCACNQQGVDNPETTADTTQNSTYDFGAPHYSVQIPVYEIVRAQGIWGPVEYGNFVYNDKGQLVEKTNAENEAYVYTYEYDELGRLVKETETTPYGYDTSIFSYGDEEMQYFFEITDFQNRRGAISKEEMLSSDADINGNTISHEYEMDEYGRIVQDSYSNPSVGSTIILNFEYDERGCIVKEHQSSYDYGKQTGGYETTLVYDALGRRIREDFTDITDGWTGHFLNEYGVSRMVESSSETDDDLMTTDQWIGFPEVERIPIPSSCIKSIRQAEEAEGEYTFTLPENYEESDLAVRKYLAVLTDVCGLSYEIGETTVSIHQEGKVLAQLFTGTDLETGNFLHIYIPEADDL